MAEITVTYTIPAPAARVWEKLRSFELDYLGGFPYLLQGAGVGAERSFNLPDGEMVERITALDDSAMTLHYEIVRSPWPVTGYLAEIRVRPDGDGAEVAWSARFEPSGASEEDASRIVAGTFKMNLRQLEKHFSA